MTTLTNYTAYLNKLANSPVLPNHLKIGQTIALHYQCIDQKNIEQLYIYEGVIIAFKNKNRTKTMTIRRFSNNSGVEQIFCLTSPNIQKIIIKQQNSVHRSKLYFLKST